MGFDTMMPTIHTWNVNVTMLKLRQLIYFLLIVTSYQIHAGNSVASVTLDNDYFVNSDDGYTSGLYLAVYEKGSLDNESVLPQPSFLVTPLLWSMPSKGVDEAINAYNIGQSMFTPSDITRTVPDANDIPYSAIIALTNSYILSSRNHADVVSTTVGVVGPAALGKQSQNAIHSILGSEAPKGWDAQLRNEAVFQFGRGRVWRSWSSELDDYDLLTTAKANLGTLQSSVSSNVIVRYGRDLRHSFASVLLMDTRTSNPIAVDGEWYLYLGVQAQYVFNQIYTDGNTYRDSASVDYDHTFIGLNYGLTYSWGRSALTFAVNHSDLFQSDSEQYRNDTRYGTLTYSWSM